MSHDGLIAALWLSSDDAQALALPDGETPDELHITLCYMGKISDIASDTFERVRDVVQQFANEHGPIRGQITGVQTFAPTENSDGKQVIFAAYDASGLGLWREKLASALEAVGANVSRKFEYTPHITLRYQDEESQSIPTVNPRPLTFSALTLGAGKYRETFPFGGIFTETDLEKAQDVHGYTRRQGDRMVHVQPYVRQGNTKKQLTLPLNLRKPGKLQQLMPAPEENLSHYSRDELPEGFEIVPNTQGTLAFAVKYHPIRPTVHMYARSNYDLPFHDISINPQRQYTFSWSNAPMLTESDARTYVALTMPNQLLRGTFAVRSDDEQNAILHAEQLLPPNMTSEQINNIWRTVNKAITTSKTVNETQLQQLSSHEFPDYMHQMRPTPTREKIHTIGNEHTKLGYRLVQGNGRVGAQLVWRPTWESPWFESTNMSLVLNTGVSTESPEMDNARNVAHEILSWLEDRYASDAFTVAGEYVPNEPGIDPRAYIAWFNKCDDLARSMAGAVYSGAQSIYNDNHPVKDNDDEDSYIYNEDDHRSKYEDRPDSQDIQTVAEVDEADKRDKLSRALWNDKATVLRGTFKYNPLSNITIASISQKLFGRELTDSEWMGVVGAPDGSQVSVYPWSEDSINISVRHPYIAQMSRLLEKTGDTIDMYNSSFFLNENNNPPKGFGAHVFATEVFALQKLGVSSISTHGIRSDTANGYYTWPRFGYNAVLPSYYRQSLPANLKTCQDFHDLMSTQEGRDWWKEHGDGMEFTFDLSPNSKSIQRLKNYLREAQIELEKAFGVDTRVFAQIPETPASIIHGIPMYGEEIALSEEEDAALDRACDMSFDTILKAQVSVRAGQRTTRNGKMVPVRQYERKGRDAKPKLSGEPQHARQEIDKRDVVTKRHWSSLENDSHVDVEDEAIAQKLVRRIMNDAATPDDIANIAAMPDNTKSTLYPDGNSLWLSVTNSKLFENLLISFTASRDVKTSGPSAHLELAMMRVGAPHGIGSRWFGQFIENLQRNGFTRLDMNAAGSPGDKLWNGYYTWPRLGANNVEPLDDKILNEARNDLHVSKNTPLHDLNDIMQTPGGAEWWKQHGFDIDVVFDLSKNSAGLKILKQYLEKKNIKLHKAQKTERRGVELFDIEPEEEKLLDELWAGYGPHDDGEKIQTKIERKEKIIKKAKSGSAHAQHKYLRREGSAGHYTYIYENDEPQSSLSGDAPQGVYTTDFGAHPSYGSMPQAHEAYLRYNMKEFLAGTKMTSAERKQTGDMIMSVFECMEQANIRVDGRGVLSVIAESILDPNDTETILGMYDTQHTTLLVGKHHPESMVHELGHFIDQSMYADSVGRKGQIIKIPRGITSVSTDTDVVNLLKTLDECDSQSTGKFISTGVDPSFISYLKSPHEMFARAFAAYMDAHTSKLQAKKLFGESWTGFSGSDDASFTYWETKKYEAQLIKVLRKYRIAKSFLNELIKGRKRGGVNTTHKYLRKENGKYIYKEIASTQRQKETSASIREQIKALEEEDKKLYDNAPNLRDFYDYYDPDYLSKYHKAAEEYHRKRADIQDRIDILDEKRWTLVQKEHPDMLKAQIRVKPATRRVRNKVVHVAGYTRYYHGTGLDYQYVDSLKFDKAGLFGPGYYLTDNPEVASSYSQQRNQSPLSSLSMEELERQLAKMNFNLAQTPKDDTFYQRIWGDSVKSLEDAIAGKRMDVGPNIRIINVPNSLNLLDANKPVTKEFAEQITAVLPPNAEYVFRGKELIHPTFLSLYDNLLESLNSYGGQKEESAVVLNHLLASIGYDGIKYEGGNIMPLKNAKGKPIKHNAVVIFAESVKKLNNALSKKPESLKSVWISLRKAKIGYMKPVHKYVSRKLRTSGKGYDYTYPEKIAASISQEAFDGRNKLLAHYDKFRSGNDMVPINEYEAIVPDVLSEKIKLGDLRALAKYYIAGQYETGSGWADELFELNSGEDHKTSTKEELIASYAIALSHDWNYGAFIGLSIALQGGAAKAWPTTKFPDTYVRDHVDAYSGTDTALDVLGNKHAVAALSATAKAIYDETQRHLKKLGITRLVIARAAAGVLDEQSAKKLQNNSETKTEEYGEATIQLNPLSAWTLSPQTAANYFKENNKISRFSDENNVKIETGQYARPPAVVFVAEVSAEQIFSIPTTGPGVLQVDEIVVLGDKPIKAQWMWTRSVPRMAREIKQRLTKSKRGYMKPSHKYLRRTLVDGKYEYTYAEKQHELNAHNEALDGRAKLKAHFDDIIEKEKLDYDEDSIPFPMSTYVNTVSRAIAQNTNMDDLRAFASYYKNTTTFGNEVPGSSWEDIWQEDTSKMSMKRLSEVYATQIAQDWNYSAFKTTMLAMQSIAPSIWPTTHFPDKYVKELHKDGDDTLATLDKILNDPAARRVLEATTKAIYNNTQQYLKKLGITHITLVRSAADIKNQSSLLKLDDAYADYNSPINKLEGEATIKLNPLSSWSIFTETAVRYFKENNGLSNFGTDNDDVTRPRMSVKSPAVVLIADIPAEQIFSLPMTGPGVIDVGEAVVLGNKPIKAKWLWTRQPNGIRKEVSKKLNAYESRKAYDVPILIKALQGDQKFPHKYVSRKKKNNKYVYTYGGGSWLSNLLDPPQILQEKEKRRQQQILTPSPPKEMPKITTNETHYASVNPRPTGYRIILPGEDFSEKDKLDQAVEKAKELGVFIADKSPLPVTSNMLDVAITEVSKIPPYIIQNVKNRGLRLELIADSGITAHPEYRDLRGVKPGGFWGTYTWDDVVGIGSNGDSPIGVIVINQLQKSPTKYVILHEYGHAVDGKIGRGAYSESAEWRDIHKRTTWLDAYLTNSAMEAWADAFSYYLESPKELTVELQSYFQKVLNNEHSNTQS